MTEGDVLIKFSKSEVDQIIRALTLVIQTNEVYPIKETIIVEKIRDDMCDIKQQIIDKERDVINDKKK
jgi:hypothetical protein